MKIALTSVFVPDPVRAHEFYTQTLGFVSKMLMPEANLAIVASPEEPDGTSLLLEPNDNPIARTYQEGIYQSNLPVITFGTTDIHADYARLRAAGVVFRGEPKQHDYGTVVNFEDTCGNLIQLFQQP